MQLRLNRVPEPLFLFKDLLDARSIPSRSTQFFLSYAYTCVRTYVNLHIHTCFPALCV